MLLILLMFVLGLDSVLGGCCNSNVWCDGDPAFLTTPVAHSSEGASIVVHWNESHLHLPKCVDYFYVEYREHGDHVYTLAPVYITSPEMEDDDPFSNGVQYSANFTAVPGVVYDIRVVAVDKGSGWGALEGKAIVFSEPIEITMTEKSSAKSQLQLLIQSWQNKYADCIRMSLDERPICTAMRREWVQEVVEDLLMRLQNRRRDLGHIVDIDLRSGSYRRLYDQGRISFLEAKLIDLNLVNETAIFLNIGLKLTRLSYRWQSFLASGELSLYHTCNADLPLAIFSDVDAFDVAKLVDDQCMLHLGIAISHDLPINSDSIEISVELDHLNGSEFRYDATWMSRSMHNLALLWKRQRVILEQRMSKIVSKMARDAFRTNVFQAWKDGKWSDLDLRIDALQNEALNEEISDEESKEEGDEEESKEGFGEITTTKENLNKDGKEDVDEAFDLERSREDQ